MASLHALSDYALSDGIAVPYTPESLRRLAQARTAEHVVFLELIARSNNVTLLDDVLPSTPNTGIRPISGLPTSASELPRTERSTVSFLFATRPWCGKPTDVFRPNQRALPRIITAGRISRSVPIDSSVQRRGQRTIGDAQLANPDGALDDLLTNYTLEGGSIRAWLAAPGDDSDQWALLYAATIGEVEATRKDIRISITTVADELERPLQLRRYTGSGGLAGDANVTGRLRPTAWGEVFGADPVLISRADWIYQVHDSRIQSIDWVREGGLGYTFTADFPDYDALAGATLAAGQYATCLAYGLFRIGVTAEGLVYPIRVGLQGDATGSGYVSATGDILYRMARDRALLAAGSVDVDSLAGLPRGRVGFYTNGSDDLTVAQVFDQLLRGLVGTYGVGRSQSISVQRLLPAEFSLSDLTLRGEQLFDVRVEARPYSPRNAQPYTYAPTFAPLTDDEVSPEADESVAARLKVGAQTGYVYRATTAVVPQLPVDPLVTYFAEQDPAREIAEDALAFSARNLIPFRAELGRAGLLTELGRVLSVDDARFAKEFRGVIYEMEDDLGGQVTSRIVALGSSSAIAISSDEYTVSGEDEMLWGVDSVIAWDDFSILAWA
jgi:hypothetical protein